jgi:hypothetical protein
MKFLALAVVFLSVQPLWAASAAPGQGGGLMTFAPLIAIVGIFYFPLDSSPAETGQRTHPHGQRVEAR